MNLEKNLRQIAKGAQIASRLLSGLSTAVKNKTLKDMSRALLAHKETIKKANQKDLSSARKLGFSQAFIDRLTLNDKRIKEMVDSLSGLVKLADPVGETIKKWTRPNGLEIHKVRVPIGVALIIYESRPNVTAECIGLCFKSGNSVILRGGKEAVQTNLAIYKILQAVLKRNRIPEGAVNMVATTDRRAINILLKLDKYIDLVMPRGGEGLIKKVVSLSRIPVIKHYKGICHVFVDKYADLAMAEKICFNAKVQRPGVCNAMESMLVHQDIAKKFLPAMIEIFKKAGVEIRGCTKTAKIVKGIKAASEKDYHTEYLDLISSVKVVDSVKAAIEHINNYGTHHSDAIVTKNKLNAEKFLREVDSACVYLNASTRFTDGYQFGLGAEIGISTDKLHARGPMALEELTTYKYVVFGDGQIRS
ncbi:MAG: glutamate-5-semialdehyde dehydrogenase [Candidatus Omnitrophica bacterium]|jgi:glutamate-5-semialdehyde dehydrogenase|nr:glutamate-5-semialdehyde dehydrogenase [Candidatus Omnitrophota bacterium]